MDKEKSETIGAFINAHKGKRKFVQSVELAINFSGLDMSKQQNRLNLEVRLPNGKGKAQNVIVFADDQNLTAKAKEAGARVIPSSEMTSIATDKVKLNGLLDYEMLAQPSLMPQVAKAFGQFLGPRNKMPKPLLGGDVGASVSAITKSIYLRSKGKYLPTVHCIVGNESMEISQITANIDEVLNAVASKVGKQYIKSVFLKLTMSPSVRI